MKSRQILEDGKYSEAEWGKSICDQVETVPIFIEKHNNQLV